MGGTEFYRETMGIDNIGMVNPWPWITRLRRGQGGGRVKKL